MQKVQEALEVIQKQLADAKAYGTTQQQGEISMETLESLAIASAGVDLALSELGKAFPQPVEE